MYLVTFWTFYGIYHFSEIIPIECISCKYDKCHQKLSRRYKCYSNLFQNVSDFDLKNWQFLVKLGSNLAKIRFIFLAISRAAFLARNVSQIHFPFSREMREMCRSTLVTRNFTLIWKYFVKSTVHAHWKFRNFTATFFRKNSVKLTFY